MTGHRILRILGFAECASLAVLLGNLFTLDLPQVSRALGPIHGLCYIGVIIAAILVAEGMKRVWLLALVPGVGGLLATRAHNGRVTTP